MEKMAQLAWVLSCGRTHHIIRVEGFEVKNMHRHGFYNYVGSHDIVYYGNKVHDIGRRSISCSASDTLLGNTGAYTDGGVYNVTYDSNLFYNIGRIEGGCSTNDYNHDHGLYLAGHDQTIINNIFYDTKAGWGVQVQPEGSSNGHYFDIINNTFYGTNPGRNGHIVLVGCLRLCKHTE